MGRRRNLRIEYRWAAGKIVNAGRLAAELVAAGAEVIVASGDVTTRAARRGAGDTVIE